MDRCLAFVLSGGGARGALQVGAIRALVEAGYQPNLLVGTSIGAVNAAALALWGIDLAGVSALEGCYQEVAEAHLMDPRLVRLALRALAGRPNRRASQRLAEYFISKGFSPDLCFSQLAFARLAVISADLNSGSPMIYGADPSQSILEGLMASIALPPWFLPVEIEGHFVVDGGALSNLPIEPALELGATEIIALDLSDPDLSAGTAHALNLYLGKTIYAITQRQIYLETALAEARGIPVRSIRLRSYPPVPLWDFSSYASLIQCGYETACREIGSWADS